MSGQTVLYPLEFFVSGTPVSLGSSGRSKDRWKESVKRAAEDRVRETDELGFLDNRRLSVTIFYFSATPMSGDIDNIVKPIMDALKSVAYPDDQLVERLVVQKFEADFDWGIASPTGKLAEAIVTPRPVVYIRVDDDLGWRRHE